MPVRIPWVQKAELEVPARDLKEWKLELLKVIEAGSTFATQIAKHMKVSEYFWKCGYP